MKTTPRPAGPPRAGDLSKEAKMESEHNPAQDAMIINEAQLLLAEKRTSLSYLRTGVTVFALPLTVLSFLIATSKYYDIIHVMYLLVPLVAVCVLLALLGAFMIIRAILRIHAHDRTLKALKAQNSLLGPLCD